MRADEVTALRGFLDYHRDTFRWKCAGLTQEQLAPTHPPSTMTLGGMMKHLALNEVGWFGHTLAGTPYPPPFDDVDWDADPDWEWRTAADDSPERAPGALRRLRTPRGRRDRRGSGRAVGLDAESVEQSSRGRRVQPALDPAAHDRGVRAAQRPGRPDPRVHRRRRPVSDARVERRPRVDPPLHGDEAAILRAFLTYHRDTLRRKCAG